MSRHFAIALAMLLDLYASAAIASTRLAVITSPGGIAEKVAALLEASLPAAADVHLLEREQLKAIVQEQQLDACFGPTTGTTRLKLGQLLQADAMVALRESKTPKPHLELVVFETRHGYRLLSEPATITTDLIADAARIQQRIVTALKKQQEGITAVVAIPDFECTDLTREFSETGRGYAPLVAQSLLRRKGVLVVEIAEARAIAQELAIDGKSRVDRPASLFLLGDFHDDREGTHHTLTLHMMLKCGDTQLSDAASTTADPEKPAVSLMELTDRVIGNNLSQPMMEVDPAADAKQLYSRGSIFLNISEFGEALSLCEASLLLESQPLVHRDVAFAIGQLLNLDRESKGQTTAARGLSLDDELPHLETYMKEITLDYSAPENRVIRMFLRQASPATTAEMLARVARAKLNAKVQDDTMRFAVDIFWSQITPSSRRYALSRELALCVQRPQDEKWIAQIFAHHSPADTSPEMTESMEALSSSANPLARELVPAIAQALRENKLRSASGPDDVDQSASPAYSSEQAEVTLVPLVLGFFPAGCFPAGDNLDISWGVTGTDNVRAVFVIPKDGPAKSLFITVSRSRPAYDGQFVWAPGGGAASPQIVIADPITGQQSTIGISDGLPNEQIFSFAAAPLAPGRVCAAAGIGSMQNLRSWIAILSVESAAGKGGAAKVTLLNGATKSRIVPGATRSDADVAFSPQTAERITPTTIGFSSLSGWRIVTFPTAESTRTGEGATVISDAHTLGRYVQAGQVYYTVKMRADDETHGQLFRGNFDGKGPQLVNPDAPFGSIAITNAGTYVFCSQSLLLYRAESPVAKFHPLKTAVLTKYLSNAAAAELCLSNRYGLLICDGTALLQFQDRAGNGLRLTKPTTQPAKK